MTAIIIEDENISLVFLKEIIEKKFPNITIIRCFTTAEDALEFMEINTVTFIITDIKLPGMNGIEFSQICTKNHPFTPIILLSAYNEFEYARSVINTNVICYISKPLIYDDLLRAINAVERKVVPINATKFPNFLSIDQYSLFFKDYFYGAIENLDERLTQLPAGFNLKGSNLIVFSMGISQYSDYLNNIWHYGEQRLIYSVNSILLSSFENFKATAFASDTGTIDIVCIFRDAISENFSLQISHILHSTLKLKCSVHQLTVASSIENIKSNSSEYKIKKLIYTIFNNGYFSMELLKQLDDNEKVILCRKILENLIAVLGIAAVSKENELSFYSKNKAYSYDELAEHITHLIEYINKNKVAESHDAVASAIQYIENNFNKPLSLSVLARHVALSEKYLSRIFKLETGQGIANYIDDFRIKKAVVIIKSDPDIKLYTLAYQLGYESQSTFSKNFKKHMGLSPAQYAEDLKQLKRKAKQQ